MTKSKLVKECGVDLSWSARPLKEQLSMTVSNIHLVSFQSDRDAIYDLYIGRLLTDAEAAKALNRLAKKIDAEVKRAAK